MSGRSKSDTEAFEQRFITEFLKDYKGAAAVRRAGGADQSGRPASKAFLLLRRSDIRATINRLEAERMGRVKVEADTVLREILAIATADTNEIMEVRKHGCRYCHGVEHRYQYENQRELTRAQMRHEKSDEGLVDAFEHGGLGYDRTAEPNEDCPQCGGEGVSYVHVKDTRLLSPGARALFAGAKQTKDGVEVKLHDKSKHLELLARHLGLLNDKLEITGDLAERINKARKRA